MPVQKLTCPECKSEFEFDPEADEKVITSLNESFRPERKEITVNAYLTCPKGHKNKYSVKKVY